MKSRKIVLAVTETLVPYWINDPPRYPRQPIVLTRGIGRLLSQLSASDALADALHLPPPKLPVVGRRLAGQMHASAPDPQKVLPGARPYAANSVPGAKSFRSITSVGNTKV
jgi:hypothetical protein